MMKMQLCAVYDSNLRRRGTRSFWNRSPEKAWGLSSVGRARRSQRRGQGFDSPLRHHSRETSLTRRVTIVDSRKHHKCGRSVVHTTLAVVSGPLCSRLPFCSHRLVAKDTGLSRRRHGFDSRWEYHLVRAPFKKGVPDRFEERRVDQVL